ncbi:hypothetical protein [Sphingobium sp. MK2]|uniref:hypothetical protein n=1 Tax=Sphingobium sp. MK2 TaxID=3116540 RepID=UPI0032E35D2F
MAKKGNKTPKSAYLPITGKQARAGSGADLVPAMSFRWSLDRFDWLGPFSCKEMTPQVFSSTIISHLQAFDAMTWNEIDGPTGSHFVSVSDLIKPARKRLVEIGMEDTDQLFSLRCGGKPRIWGIREIAVLRVLWWDPEHEICPSTKKHT